MSVWKNKWLIIRIFVFCYYNSILVFSEVSTVTSNSAYQVALGVVIPVFVLIIIAVVLYFVRRNRPSVVCRRSDPTDETVEYENQAFDGSTKASPESAYDHIDPEDIDMSSNVYDQVDEDGDKVEYETVG